MKNTVNKLQLAVTRQINGNSLPSSEHEFLMETKEVAHGYGVSDVNIREHKRVNEELIEGKHFVTGVRFSDSDPVNKVYWTKRGIVRLGFFIKSEEAKQFRDWAEDLILMVDKHMSSPNNFANQRALPAQRRNNRLTPTRLVGLLVEASKIDNNELRNSIVSKLMEGEVMD